MPIVLDATVGGVNANSYLTVNEFLDYLTTAYDPEEVSSALDDDKTLIMATRLMESMYSPQRKLVRVSPPGQSYYVIRPTWTGLVATSTQRLLWPRIGMFTRTGVAIASNVIPQELKDATAELARQLKKGDRTLDSDAAAQGIKSVQAGSVAVSFKDYFDATKVIPDIVFSMLVPSWLTDEIMESANRAEFDVIV